MQNQTYEDNILATLKFHGLRTKNKNNTKFRVLYALKILNNDIFNTIFTSKRSHC